jgi:hypothetical protein
MSLPSALSPTCSRFLHPSGVKMSRSGEFRYTSVKYSATNWAIVANPIDTLAKRPIMRGHSTQGRPAALLEWLC